MKTRTLILCLLLACGPRTLLVQEKPKVMGLQEIIVAFKTHFDIGYTGFPEAIEQKYNSSMIRRALEVLDKTKTLPPDRRFIWTLPGWPMSQILNRCDPALRPASKHKNATALSGPRAVIQRVEYLSIQTCYHSRNFQTSCT